MLKKLRALVALFIATLCASAAFAAVDVNTATEAELDGIKGIGPGLSGRILDERRSAPFKDWSDFIGRVGGVGNKSAVNFSKEGLTVNGKKFSAAAGARAEAKDKDKGKKDKTHTAKQADATDAAKPQGTSRMAPAPAGPSSTAAPAPATISPSAPTTVPNASASKN